METILIAGVIVLLIIGMTLSLWSLAVVYDGSSNDTNTDADEGPQGPQGATGTTGKEGGHGSLQPFYPRDILPVDNFLYNTNAMTASVSGDHILNISGRITLAGAASLTLGDSVEICRIGGLVGADLSPNYMPQITCFNSSREGIGLLFAHIVMGEIMISLKPITGTSTWDSGNVITFGNIFSLQEY